jgi:hypothetical protein
MKKNCETKGSNREPDEWWFPTLTTTPQIDSCLLHAFILFCTVLASSIWKFIQRPKNTSQTGFKPMITGTYRPHPNHYTTCPVLVLTCLIFSLYVNWCFRGQKIRAKRGSNPWSRAPTDHTQTTTPLAQFWFWLVWYFLYMLIDVFCGHLISRKKKERRRGIRTRDKRPHIRAPYHRTTYVIVGFEFLVSSL